MFTTLDRKLVKDLIRIWAQGLAIALVMACGVATIVLAVGAYRSLEETRLAFYDRYRFGAVFSNAVRAPQHLKSRFEAIAGVGSVELRIKQPVVLDVVGMAEPASGLIVSLPDHRNSSVNRLYLRNGRLPLAGSTREVAVLEAFAIAHDFNLGDSFSVVMNGLKRKVTIVGTVLSPEFIYAIGPGDMVPDEKRYGIFFMSRSAVSSIFNMQGSFNDLAMTTLLNADQRRVIEETDQLLKHYGGTGAYGREDHESNAFLNAELDQLNAMAKVIPPIFLFVSAFLVNMILSRLVALEREQIGLLKALGYSNLAINWHYTKLVMAIAAVGLLIGSIAGYWLGIGLTRLYASFFSFPFLIFEQSIDLYFLAGGVTVMAAFAGAVKSIWSITSLAPAVAMRPPSPESYQGFASELLNRITFLSQLTIMSLRQIVRRPVRAFLTATGTSLSVALLVTALFSYDSIDHMIDVIFFQAERQNASLTFASNTTGSALPDIRKLPGVIRAEPFRTSPVKLRNGNRSINMALIGMPQHTVLSRILDHELRPVTPPQRGLMLSDRVASKLLVKTGDLIEVEFTRKNGRMETVPVTGVFQSYVGLTAYASMDYLDRLLRDGRQVSGVRVLIDDQKLPQLYESIKSSPFIASIALQDLSRDQLRSTIEENINTMTTVYVTLAVIITFGVVYNSARIQLSERARELASLRVFGFTKAEVSRVLLVELAIIVLFAQPMGWLLGYSFSLSVVKGFESDLFRIPFVIETATFAWSSIVVLAAAIGSALIVRRRVNRLDMIRVLKTRE